MSDFDLDGRLRKARVPERPDEYWEDFPQRVLAGLRAVQAPERRAQQGFETRQRPRLALALGFAMACLAVGLAIGFFRGGKEDDSFALLRSAKLLHEVLTLFPNRVRAIEADGRGIRLVLSDKPDVPASTPLWIKVCDGKNCQAVVTFSGLALEIGGKMVDVLMDSRGQVMLVGSRFIWTSEEPNRPADGLRIQARPLAYTM